MGYYSGSGVVTGGGETTRVLKSFYEWGSKAVRQKCVYSTVKKSGVSLADAQGSHASDALTAIKGGSGLLAWTIPDAEGTKTTPAYTQISGSNLYDLNITTETFSAYPSSDTTRTIVFPD